MRIIDAHVHLYPPDVGRDPAGWATMRDEPHWAALCTRRRRDGRPVQTFPTLDQLIHDLDASQVEKAVLLGWYWEKPETCVWQNRFYADCVRAHPDRLAAFAAIHPAIGEAAIREEIRRAHDAGFCGLGELSPHSQHWRMDDPVLAVAVELAGKLGMPVNLHVTDPRGKRYPARVETPLDDFRRLAQAHPGTTFVLAHWGGGLPFIETDPVVRSDLANVVYDTAASPLIYDSRIWRTVFDVVSPDRVLFGSDYPLLLYPRTEEKPSWRGILTEIDQAGLNTAEKAQLLAGNAARLFHL
jgi:hypothetical protein